MSTLHRKFCIGKLCLRNFQEQNFVNRRTKRWCTDSIISWIWISDEDIAYYRRKGYPVREIARAIGCCHTTIYREVNRNRNDHGRYVAHQAQRKARERRKNKGG